ncbi:MAG: hypothetical protein V2B18_22660 [Pseudomonadota bacterium]
MPHQDDVCSTVAEIIRDRSASGRLIPSAEILADLRVRGVLESDPADPPLDLDVIAARALDENDDLRRLDGREGISFYYSVQSLTESYAQILVWKSEHPLRLIAEVVRDNSIRYRRPFPADGFREPPFDLTREEIAACLIAPETDDEYGDIAQITSTHGTPFLYSTKHLDPDHACMLADRLDGGLAENP